MSVSTIGSNSNSIADLLNQRRQNLQSLEASVQSGNLAAAQQALTTVQTDTSSIQSASGSTPDGSTDQGINPYRSSLATDLTGLSSALLSGSTTQAQAALTQFQTDLSTATHGTGGAHHGHHHGGGGEKSDSASSSQQIAASLFGSGTSSADPATASDPFGTGASDTSGDVLTQLLTALDKTPQSPPSA